MKRLIFTLSLLFHLWIKKKKKKGRKKINKYAVASSSLSYLTFIPVAMDTNRIILFSVQNIEILLLEIKYYNPIFDFFSRKMNLSNMERISVLFKIIKLKLFTFC